MATPDVIVPTYDDADDTSIFENKSGLADDMRFLASMPELCDVTFLVGDTREPDHCLQCSQGFLKLSD